MAEIFNFNVQDNRSIKFPKANLLEPIMQEDHNVAIWRFRIPKVLNQIDMSDWAWWFVYVNAKNETYSESLTLVDDVDEPDTYCTADYSIDYSISKFPGSFSFSLEAINAEQGGEIDGEWHTKTYTHKVDKTLQGNQAQFAETESDIISALITEFQTKIRQLVGGATPEPVSLIADMTDTSKVYLYVGEETGYTSGNWYYYNGSAWASGGQYGAGVVDAAPTQGSNNAVSSGGVYTEFTGLKEDLNVSQLAREIDLSVKDDYYVAPNGGYYPTTNNIYSKAVSVLAGQSIVLNGYGYLTNIAIFAKRTGPEGAYTYTPLVISIDTTRRTYTYTATEDMIIVVSFITKVNGTVVTNDCRVLFMVSDIYKTVVQKINTDVSNAVDGLDTEINNDINLIYGSDLYDVSTISPFSSMSARGISNVGGIIYDADKTLKGFSVKAGDLIQLNLSANSGASTAVYVFKDTDRIGGTNVGDVCFDAVNDRITVPVGAVSLFIAQATTTTYNVKSINTIVPELSEKITGASIGRLIEKSAWEQGWYNSQGSYSTSDVHRFCISDFIANAGQTVEVLDASLTVYAVFFDSSKTYLSASSAISGIMYIPESYAYFKVQLYKSTATINDVNSVIIYNNAIPNVVKNNVEKDVVVANFSQSRSLLFGDEYKPLEFIHFSDVHRQAVEWSNVCKYMDAHSKYIPFAIHTGDYVLSYNAQYNDLYEIAVPNNGYILNVVGNHDVYSNSSGTERATQATTHSLLFNHTDDWGVTFGAEGAMYYHKDFAESGIRLVVIDPYYWDTTEATWLSNVLADAITNDLAVVTAMHIATKALPVNMRVDCTFNVVDELGSASTGETDTVTAIDDAIATFIDDGGEHIVNLCGHYHHDIIGYSASGILNIAVECATHLPANWDDAVRDPATKGFDAFNVIGVDRTTKTIRIARIGNNSDWYGRAKNVLCYDYTNKAVIANY